MRKIAIFAVALFVGIGVGTGTSYATQAQATANLQNFISNDRSFHSWMQNTYGIDANDCQEVTGDANWEGTVRASSSVTQDITLTGSGTYVFVGAGCNDSNDLDMKLYDSDGTQLDSDIETDNYPICACDVTNQATVTVEIVANGCRGGSCHFAFNILHVPAGCDSAATNLENFINNDRSFHSWMENTYAIDVGDCQEVTGDSRWNGTVNASSSVTQDITLTGTGTYVFVGAGCDESNDLDMNLYDSNGTQLDSDVETDNYPICACDVTNQATVTVEIVANGTTGGACHFEFRIFHVPPAGCDSAMTNLRNFIDNDRSFHTWMMNTYGISVSDCEFVNGDTWWEGEVAQSDSVTQDITLTGNGNFIIVGAGCDESNDLDMRVYDNRGRELDSDVATDNYPICAVNITRQATIRIEIIANGTTSGSCHFAFAILSEQ